MNTKAFLTIGLLLSMLMSVSLTQAATPIATVDVVVGQVFAIDAKGKQRLLKAGDTLLPGETLKTGDGASLSFTVQGGAKVVLSANATLELNTKLATDGRTITNFKLVEGTSRISTLTATDAIFNLTTKDGDVQINGVADVTAGDKAAAVVLQAGTAQVTAKNCSAGADCTKTLDIPGMALIAMAGTLSDPISATAISMRSISSKAPINMTLADASATAAGLQDPNGISP